MKEFATPLSIVGNIEEIHKIIPDLIALGYVMYNKYYSSWDYTCLLTQFGSDINKGRLGYNQVIDTKFTTINIVNKELILALAAMTEGVKVYPGEYIVMIGNYGYPDLQKGNIYKVLKLQDGYKQNYEDQDDNTFFILEHNNNQGVAGYLSPPRRDFRKATKDEIYNHFKSKNMSEIKDENGGTDRIMTFYSDTEFKKEIIGWDVKPDIDRAAVLKIIGWEKNIRGNVGTITVEIKHNSRAYKDALNLGVLDALFIPIYKQKDEGKIVNIGLNHYVIYSNYIIYKDNSTSLVYKFTKSDLQVLIDLYGDNFSCAAVKYNIDTFRFGCNGQIKVSLDDIRMLLSHLK